jgi:hypothetical protein
MQHHHRLRDRPRDAVRACPCAASPCSITASVHQQHLCLHKKRDAVAADALGMPPCAASPSGVLSWSGVDLARQMGVSELIGLPRWPPGAHLLVPPISTLSHNKSAPAGLLRGEIRILAARLRDDHYCSTHLQHHHWLLQGPRDSRAKRCCQHSFRK